MAVPELTVRDVMDTHPVTLLPTTRVQEVVELMNQRRIGSILIADADKKLMGIFTERDLLRRVVTKIEGWREFPVAEWMTKTPHTISPEVGWEEAVGRMHKLRVRHLPVLENEQIIGIVSTRLLMSRREEYLRHRVEERTGELRDSNAELMARDAEIAHNLRTAGRLQTRILLPSAPPEQPQFRWATYYAPLDHLGGDYFDFAEEPHGVGFLIADASGHSIAAAMVAMMARFAFAQASPKDRPSAVLNVMNQRLQELTEERFVTACYGYLDCHSLRLRYSAAGHPYPLHYSAQSGRVESLVVQGFFLGIMQGEIYSERETQLAVGDKVCFTTDGVLEARNEIGEMFGVDRMKACLHRCRMQTAQVVVEEMIRELNEFRGNEPLTDDVTLAVVDILP
jgi:phosphoserine phosphatase RsbU/P